MRKTPARISKSRVEDFILLSPSVLPPFPSFPFGKKKKIIIIILLLF